MWWPSRTAPPPPRWLSTSTEAKAAPPAVATICTVGKGGGKGKDGGKGAAVRTPSLTQRKEGTAGTYKRVRIESDDNPDEKPVKKGPRERKNMKLVQLAAKAGKKSVKN